MLAFPEDGRVALFAALVIVVLLPTVAHGQGSTSTITGTVRDSTGAVISGADCKDGRIVLDVVREDKGHTEGLDPHITEQLVKMMLSAKTKKK
jgi:hypothetical protein